MLVDGDQYYRPDGVGVFPLNYAARLRTVLEVQAKRDRRHIPPVYFWRLLRPDEQGTGAAPDDQYFEEPLIHRRYAERTAAYLYVDDSGETKGAKRGHVETSGDAKIEMSRAECARLATAIAGPSLPRPGRAFPPGMPLWPRRRPA